MPKTPGPWEQRWTELRDAGLTKEQAKLVHGVIDSARGFHTETLAAVAMAKLEQVYAGDPAERVPTVLIHMASASPRAAKGDQWDDEVVMVEVDGVEAYWGARQADQS
jgi:hypothetical protein